MSALCVIRTKMSATRCVAARVAARVARTAAPDCIVN